MAGMSSLVRIVNAGVPGSQDRVDVVLRDGVVASVGPAGTVSASDSTMQTKAHTTSLEYATNAIASGSVSIPTSAAAPADETTIDADGLWVIPGLWDCHTHFTQWAKTLGRLDLINARSAAEAMDMLRRHLDERRAADTLDPDAFVVGMRFRHSLWADDEQPTLAAIDAVTGEQPVALSSADMHCGWVNSAAARRLGVHVDESGLVGELEWFNAYTAFDKAPGAAEETDRLLREAEQDAASKGVVGIRDYEMAENIDTWINRFAAGINGLRVDAGVYPERLRAAIDAGWHTGKELPGSAGLGHVGAMKLISDGSLKHPLRLLLHAVFGHRAADVWHAELHAAANRRLYAPSHRAWLRHCLPRHWRRSEHHCAQRSRRHARTWIDRACADAQTRRYPAFRRAGAHGQHPAAARHG